MKEICKVKILNEEYTAYDISKDGVNDSLPKNLHKLKIETDINGNWINKETEVLIIKKAIQ